MTDEPEVLDDQEEIQIEDNLGDKEGLVYRYDITSYGADFDVDGLVRRLNKGNIQVPTFQRGYVWNIKTASRFVESLLLGLPVPGIFLSKEKKRERKVSKYLVIDGHQRLKTLQFFYKGIFEPTGRKFELKLEESENPKFEGVTYETLSEDDRNELDYYLLHATIFEQNKPAGDDSSIFLIFERLNTGGVLLSPQEIRTCIYHGAFSRLLKKINEKNQSWRSIYRKISPRMRDQELILRFLALYFQSDKYQKPMKKFLNNYMNSNRELKLHSARSIEKVFKNTIEVVENYLGKQAFKLERGLNAAVFDSVMVGIAKRLKKGSIEDIKSLKKQHKSLLKQSKYTQAVVQGTSGEESVKIRMELAINAFKNVK